MEADILFYSLYVPKSANMRFKSSSITNLAALTGSYYAINVRVPSNFRLLSSFTLDFDSTSQITKMESANYAVIRIDETDTFYWVRITDSVANNRAAVRFLFERDPWPEMLADPRFRFKGSFNALPEITKPYQKNGAPADLIKSRSVKLPNMDITELSDYKFYWLEITTNRCIHQESTETAYYKYGCFVGVIKSGSNRGHDAIMHTEHSSSSELRYFPQISTILNKLDEIANNSSFTVEKNVLGVSIAERCPYEYEIIINGNKITGYLFKDAAHQYHTDYVHIGGSYDMYNLTDVRNTRDNIETVALTLTDQELAYCGLTLHDTQNNLIASMPNMKSITFNCQCVSDYGYMYTLLYNNDLGLRFTLQEGQLPYNSDNWETYKATSLVYDRECMQINIEKANADALNNTSSSLLSGALSGAMLQNPAVGIGTAAVGIASTIAGRAISIDNEKRLQAAKEANQKLQAGTSYNTAYGKSYIDTSCIIGGAEIRVSMPLDMSDSDLQAYAKLHGYAAAGIREIQFSKGFYSGYVHSITRQQAQVPTVQVVKPIMLVDIMNNELSEGIRIIQEVSDI